MCVWPFVCVFGHLCVCPSQTYVVHVRDVVRKAELDYKLSSNNNTVEFLLRGLEPGGRYSVTVRLRNMSKEASLTLTTGTCGLTTGAYGLTLHHPAGPTRSPGCCCTT